MYTTQHKHNSKHFNKQLSMNTHVRCDDSITPSHLQLDHAYAFLSSFKTVARIPFLCICVCMKIRNDNENSKSVYWEFALVGFFSMSFGSDLVIACATANVFIGHTKSILYDKISAENTNHWTTNNIYNVFNVQKKKTLNLAFFKYWWCSILFPSKHIELEFHWWHCF